MKTVDIFRNHSLCMQLNCSNLTEGKSLAKQFLAAKGFVLGKWKKVSDKSYVIETSDGPYRLEVIS